MREKKYTIPTHSEEEASLLEKKIENDSESGNNQSVDVYKLRLKQALDKDSVARVYDERYRESPDGKKSAYDNRFGGDPLTSGERDTIAAALNNSLPLIFCKQVRWQEGAVSHRSSATPFVVKALDFGCGEGRSLGLWLDVAKRLEKYGITVRVEAYDISEEGLKYFENHRLTNEKSTKEEPRFKEIEKKDFEGRGEEVMEFYEDCYGSGNDAKLGEKIQSKGIFRHNNLEIELLHGDPSVTPEELKSSIQSVDLSLILFGSTSHIFPRETRDGFFKAIFESTEGYVAATLPGHRSFAKELQEAKGDLSRVVRKEVGLQDNEIFYLVEVRDQTHILPYVVYTAEEMEKLAKDAGAIDSKVSVSSTLHPTEISKSGVSASYDYFVTGFVNYVTDMCKQNGLGDPSARISNPSYYSLVATSNERAEESKKSGGQNNGGRS